MRLSPIKTLRGLLLIILSGMLFSCIKGIKEPTSTRKTLVKILGGGTPANITKNPIDFVPTPVKLLMVDLRRDVNNESELFSNMNVIIKDDTAAVTAAGYLHLPSSWYTIQAEVPKIGGLGGTFSFVFKPSEFAKQIYITISDATVMDPSKLYGLGFTIQSVDANGQISHARSVVAEIGAKNAYDGIYSVESGFVQRYTAPGVPEPLGGLNGSLAGNPDVIMATVSSNAVVFPSSGTVGALYWANGSNSQVAGINGLKATVDPATNLVTMSSTQNATLSNWAGHVNEWNPATKTFTLAFRWNPASTTREYEVVLKYKGPR